MSAVALFLAACSAQSAPPAPQPSISSQPLAVPVPPFPAGITLPTGITAKYVTATDIEPGGATLGALLDLTTGAWTPVAYPGAASTAAYGPALTSNGFRIVGSYKRPGAATDDAFVYDSAKKTFATIDPPASFCAPASCNEAIAHSSYGAAPFAVVGNCDDVAAEPLPPAYPATGNAWLYDSSTGDYTLIDVPASVSTTAYGIWNGNGERAVAGGYSDARGTHGYVRGLTGGMMLTYDYPGALVTHFEGIAGAGGAGDYDLAGDYSGADGTVYGFWLPVRNWVAGTPIVLGAVSANSVYGNTVVGVMPAGTETTGYIATVP